MSTEQEKQRVVLPWLREVRGEDLGRLQAAAAADKHLVLAATHVVERGGEIVGYVSVGGVPVVMSWVDSKRVRSRESLGLLNLVENVVAARGGKAVCVPCAVNSPFRPYMEGLGYCYYGETGIFVKGLK